MENYKDYTQGVLDIIKEEMETIISSDPQYYGQFRIVLSNEQQFVKESDRDPNTIYIVVKFMSGTPFFGQIMLPININAVGEANDVEVCQRLLLEFASTFNLNSDAKIDDALTKQVYSTPQVINNFGEVFEGFRTLFYMTGTFLVGVDNDLIETVQVKNIVTGEDDDHNPIYYNLQFLSAQWSFDNQLDPQAFTGTHNRTKSEAKIFSVSISFVVYMKNDEFSRIVREMTFNKNSTLKNNYTFTLLIKFKSETNPYEMDFKLANGTGQQNIGEFPSIALTFTN